MSSGNVKVYQFPQPGRVGGAALLGFFQFVNLLNHDTEITVTSDVDSFVSKPRESFSV